jgi:hypothetical protein
LNIYNMPYVINCLYLCLVKCECSLDFSVQFVIVECKGYCLINLDKSKDINAS